MELGQQLSSASLMTFNSCSKVWWQGEYVTEVVETFANSLELPTPLLSKVVPSTFASCKTKKGRLFNTENEVAALLYQSDGAARAALLSRRR